MQPESLFPISLNLQGRTCLMLGGGPIALTKCRALLEAGATVHMIADRLDTDLALTVTSGQAVHIDTILRPAHLAGIALAIDSGEMPASSQLLRRLTQAHGILLNAVDRPALCDFHMPAVVRRGPLQIAISTGGMAPALARNLRQMIERLLPRGIEQLVRRAGALRAEVKQRFSPSEQRAFWNRMFENPTAEPLDDLPPDRLTDAEITGIPGDRREGAVWLVGAGAGSADLITLRGLRALEGADLILYDALIDPALLEHARRDARLVAVGKRCGRRSTPQDFINRLMVRGAKAGNRVVRLKCGDPFIFGRGGEELEHLLSNGIQAHVVPGVTAASVAAADVGIPLTHRGVSRRLTLMTATTGNGLSADNPDWHALMSGGTVALYMARNKLGHALSDMVTAGIPLTTPVTLVSNAGRVDRRLATGSIHSFLNKDAPDFGNAPLLVLIGESARPMDRPITLAPQTSLSKSSTDSFAPRETKPPFWRIPCNSS